MPGENPLLVETANGPTLLWKGLSFYPSGNPLEYARRKARVFSPPPRTLVFVPSVGLGYGLVELLQRLPEGTTADRLFEAMLMAPGAGKMPV